MSEQTDPARWTRSGGADPRSAAPIPGGLAISAEPAHATPLTRFLGGSPIAVFTRLLVVSLIVGAMLMWLDIRPIDVLRGVQNFVARIWNLGFDAVREIAQYVLVGALFVVPVWLVLRLMAVRPRQG